MVLYEVFSHSVKIRYLTSIFSRASLVQFVCVVLSLLSPFLIAYYTGGFWIKDKQFLEKGKISFQYRYICVLEDDTDIYISSTYDTVNTIYATNFRPSIRMISELDENGDGYKDFLDFTLFMSGVPQTVKNVKLLLLFNVSLSVFAKLDLETIGYVDGYNSKTASQVELSGQLEFVQKAILKNSIYYDYTYHVLNQTHVDLDELNLPKIIRDYNSRDYSTRLVTDAVTWKNTLSDGFTIQAYVRYAPLQIHYTPGFWEQFKYGWIQYISILIPFLFVFKLAKILIFENQLVPTIVVDPAHKIKIS